MRADRKPPDVHLSVKQSLQKKIRCGRGNVSWIISDSHIRRATVQDQRRGAETGNQDWSSAQRNQPVCLSSGSPSDQPWPCWPSSRQTLLHVWMHTHVLLTQPVSALCFRTWAERKATSGRNTEATFTWDDTFVSSGHPLGCSPLPF